MDINTCKKYLDFIALECERYLKSGQITDDKLIQLIVEYKRFVSQVETSSLDDEIKNKLKELSFDYTIRKVNRGTNFLILAFLTFGTWALVLHYKKQSKRKNILKLMIFDARSISSWLTLNY